MSVLGIHGRCLLWSTCRTSMRCTPSWYANRGVETTNVSWHGRRLTRCYSGSVDIDTLSKLSQIRLSEEEKAEMGPQIERLVEWVGQLQQVDVSGVPPAMRGVESRQEDTSWLRADEAVETPPDEIGKLLGQVPGSRLSDNGFIMIPKTND